MQETWVQYLGGEDALEKGMATRSCILAWRNPRTEEPGGLPSMRSQGVGHTHVGGQASASGVTGHRRGWKLVLARPQLFRASPRQSRPQLFRASPRQTRPQLFRASPRQSLPQLFRAYPRQSLPQLFRASPSQSRESQCVYPFRSRFSSPEVRSAMNGPHFSSLPGPLGLKRGLVGFLFRPNILFLMGKLGAYSEV